MATIELTEESYREFKFEPNKTKYQTEQLVANAIRPRIYYDYETRLNVTPSDTTLKSLRLRFECIDGGSAKWWEIEANIPDHSPINTWSYTTKWAKIGKEATAKQTKTVNVSSEWRLSGRVRALMYQKDAKGYRQVTTPTKEPPAPPPTPEEISARAIAQRFKVF